jgi:hypothetical protein
MWAQMAKAALAKIRAGSDDAAFYDAKLHTARFFFTRMLPESEFRFRAVAAGASTLMDIPAEAF